MDHTADVRHFDVKPDNMMFDSNGDLKLIDLGMANFYVDLSEESESEEVKGIFLPRKSIWCPLYYDEGDFDDSYAFAIVILNIMLYVGVPALHHVIGSEQVRRDNVKAKLQTLLSSDRASSFSLKKLVFEML